MELTNEDLYLTSSNTDVSVQVVISDPSLEIKTPGKIVVPGNYFIQIIRKINGRKIDISLIEDKIIVIKADRSEFKLNLLSVFDYPNIDFVCLDKPLVLSSKNLRTIIRETAYATSANEKRPILTGVSLKYTNNKLLAIATDSFRLSQKITELDNLDFNDFNIVVPYKSLDELSKALEAYNEDVEIYFNKIKIVFKFKNILFQSRLLDGSYPDTSRLIPEQFPVKVRFNKDELLAAIDRVSLLSTKDKENQYNVVKFNIREDHVVEISSSSTEIGNAVEEIIPTDPVEGPALKIAFSAKYITDALKSFTSPEVLLCFTGEVRPFICKGDLDYNLTALILPVRVDW
jgi:DNA polymerase-3 subunit beta